MSDPSGRSKPPRQYPAFWEKGVPIFLGILGLAVLILLIVIFVVAASPSGAF
jgi:hypothetical protein